MSAPHNVSGLQPGTQTLSFAKKEPKKGFVSINTKPVKFPDSSILHETGNRRLRPPPWTFGIADAFRLLILIRTASAYYMHIADADETFNYWEPLHYLFKGRAFQTWEYSPVYALRSYFYLFLNMFPGASYLLLGSVFPRTAFFLTRVFLAAFTSGCEVFVYAQLRDHMHYRTGRYFLVASCFSAALWQSAPALLPTSLAMNFLMLAYGFALKPSEALDQRRIVLIGLFFGVAVFVGWPPVGILAIPIIYEQLFLHAKETVAVKDQLTWRLLRLKGLLLAGLASLIPLVLMTVVDSAAYGKLTFTVLNLIKYNATGNTTLYGTEPYTYYIKSGLLAFNIVLVLGLIAPILIPISALVDPKRGGDLRDRAPGTTSPFFLAWLRTIGAPVFFVILSLQSHKEERFLYPIYPLLLANFSVSVLLIRGYIERLYTKITKSPHRTGQTNFMSWCTFLLIFATSLVSIFRVCALWKYYHAPLNVYSYLQHEEVSRVVIDRYPGMFNVFQTGEVHAADEYSLFYQLYLEGFSFKYLDYIPSGNLTLCVGKEWHRFPSHFFVNEAVTVRFLDSEFNGILPKPWVEDTSKGSYLARRSLDSVPTGMNSRNIREEAGRFAEPESCQYIIDVDYPIRYDVQGIPPSPKEPRYIKDSENWQPLYCWPFLDAENTPLWARVIYVPFVNWGRFARWGDYCLIRSKHM